MNFTTETRVKDIALSNPQARQLLEDAGVDYCCGGSKSLHDACMNAEISAEEILERLRRHTKDVSPEAAQWMSSPLSDLTSHIRAKHHRYVRAAIRQIVGLLDKVETKHGSTHPEIARIRELFTRIAQEMTAHMQKEEYVLFPYIEAMERSMKENRPLEPPFFQTVRNPIQTMMKEHDTAGDLVRQ